MFKPHFLAFLLTFASFILLILITFSVPFISNFYFLRTSMSGGVVFGVWGWCSSDDAVCSPKRIGYDWEPQLTFWLTQALVLYPVSTGFTGVAVLSLVPLLCSHRRDRYYPTPLFAMFALLSCLTSFFAFIFMIALFSTAMQRFKRDGFDASFGPLPWMSLGAMIGLAVVAMSSGCGLMCQGRFSRVSPRLAYNV